MLSREIIAVSYECHTKGSLTLCGQNAGSVTAKADGTYTYNRLEDQ
jgi:hypothetical protein